MKKIIVMLLIAAMVCSMMACTGVNEAVNNETVPGTPNSGQNTGGTQATDPTDTVVDPTVPTEDSQPTQPSVPGETEPNETEPEETEPEGGNEGANNTQPSQPVETPHKHSYTTKVTNPTCTKAGKTVYTCSCGDSYKVTEPALDHDYKDEVVEPEYGYKGYTLHTCQRCGKFYKDSYVPALRGTPQEIAEATLKWLNYYRSLDGEAPATAVNGLTTIAQERANQLVDNFEHDSIALKQICNKYKYGEYVDMTEVGLDASKNYYTFGGAEAIGDMGFYWDPDVQGRKTAEMFYNSSGHWRYVGDGENAYVGIGVVVTDTLSVYVCICLSKVNYG